MTARPAQSIDLEALVRDALSSVAVIAYARRIDLSVHIDHRLPGRAVGDPAALGAFLCRGLSRMIEAGRTGKIVLAFWREGGDADGGGRILLEAGRTAGEEGPHATRLGDLWRLALGEGTAEPQPHRHDAAAETVLVALPCTTEPGAPPGGERWRETFGGRFVLHCRDVVCDPARLRASLDALGLEADFTTDPDAALSLARERVAAGKPVDLLLVEAYPLGAAGVALARRFRADPDLRRVGIVLVGSHRGPALSDEERALFDAMPSISLPWRRLFEVLRDLLAVRRDDATPPPEPGRRGGEVPALAGRRILVAEDVAANQVLLRAVLEPTGAAIEAVSAGDDVVRRQTEAPADLVIMDLQMPGMGGIQAAESIRALGGGAGRVPIVALTAYAGDADRERALAAGMDAFLAKPIVLAEFYDLLRRLLGGEQDTR